MAGINDELELSIGAYRSALETLSDGDFVSVAAAFRRLFLITEKTTLPPVLLVRADGFRVLVTFWLSQGNLENALQALNQALAIMYRVGPTSDSEELGLNIADIPLVISGVSQTYTAPQSKLDYGKFFVGALDCMLAGAARPVCFDPEQVISAVRTMPLNTHEVLRCIVSSFAFGVGMSATDRHESGSALSWYLCGARLLESLERHKLFGFKLSQYLYPCMAFERQRNGDLEAMRSSINRFDKCLRRFNVEDQLREKIILSACASSEMGAALAAGNTVAAREHTDEYLRLNGKFLREQRPQHYQALLEGAEGRSTLSSVPISDASLLNPGCDLHEFFQAMQSSAESGDPSEFIGLSLESIFGDNKVLIWRSAGMLMKIFDGLSDQYSGFNPLAAMFGKLSARSLQFMRFDSVARRYSGVNPFRDDMAERVMRDLIALLVRNGRLGEALRVDLLLGLEQQRVPAPHLRDIERAVDDSVPLSAGENKALSELQVMIDQAHQTRNSILTMRDLERIGQNLCSAHAAVEVGQELSEVGGPVDGAAVLSVHEVGDNIFISFADACGRQKTISPISASRLNEIAYDALQKLRSHSHDGVLTPCRALYDLIVRPFEAMLQRDNSKILIIQASGALRRIPFGVLFDGEHFLIERHAIVLHPGVRSINIGRGICRPIHGVSLAVTTATDMPALPAALFDSQVLCELARVNRAGYFQQFIDKDVTSSLLDGIASRRPSVLHLSCHFETDPTDAGKSAFVLGDGSRYSLERMAQVDLSSVDLALLLGCETRAIGDVKGGSGITALDSLLLQMGVGSVVGTAWRVRDNTAHQLLKCFLEGLFVNSLDQAHALQAAILQVGRHPDTGRMGHPSDWGAYTLSGGWRGLHS